MSRRSSWRTRAVASTGSLAAFSTAVAVLALQQPGIATTHVDLDDGGVWVTNASLGLLAHLNFQSHVLDSGLRAASTDFDVLQDGSTVVLADTGAGTVSPVDVANVVLDHTASLPSDAVVTMGADRIAVLAAHGRSLWVTGAGAIGQLDTTQTPPSVKLPGAGVATVSSGGVVLVAVPSAQELWRVDPSGGVSHESLDVGKDDHVAITAVGDEAVVLDRDRGRLLLPGGRSAQIADAQDAQLQQPGPKADGVLVATASALVGQPLSGGAPTSTPAGGSGTPAAPVALGGCGYAAWSGSARYVRDCAGTAADVAQTLPGGTGTAPLRFRVNRSVVVLNDLGTGAIWLTDSGLTRVDQWQDVTPPPDESKDDSDDATDESDDQAAADRSGPNRKPIAQDDDFGVRPGRTTVLPVLANDSDPDGDVLTASVTTTPSIGTVQSIFGGTALQVAVPADAHGSTRFTYQADDGRGGTADATVTLTVRTDDQEEAPHQLRVGHVTVEQGATATYDVLPDWTDPDGDELFLQSASVTTGDQVRFTADGTVTFQDVGTSQGRKTVDVVVSDGRQSTEGTLVIDVRPRGELPPVANADHATTVVGRSVQVAPLANDTDPNGDALRLARVDSRTDVAIVPSFDAGTFTFESDTAGTYYVGYVVTDGPSTTPGVVRIDVLAAPDAGGAPIAVHDTALLPLGGTVYADVLANDVDPAGGVLVVQSVSPDPQSGLRVAIVDHHLLRISAATTLDGPVSVPYTVSNGAQSAVGDVVVIPVPRDATTQPPAANDDTAVVRAGDVVDVAVLANDQAAPGDTLTLQHGLVQQPEAGLAFVSGDVVRFQAPLDATTVHLVYEVTDSTGQTDSAQVTITVRAADAQHDSPPRPQDLEARVLAGGTVRIAVPLDGLDPDGDSVTLLGVDQAPAQGVVEVGAGWLSYRATEGAAGTDTFSYAVTDRLGARATASVRVGIAPAVANQPPVAVDDTVTVRPDRDVAVAVLVNDVDPDGDQLSLVPDGVEVVGGDVTAKAVGDRVELRTPSAAGPLTVYYVVSDGRGGRATGSLTIQVDPDAQPLPPVARDDTVALADLAPGATTARVDVLANDEDPDGSAADLVVSLPDGAGTVSDKGVVTLPLAAQAQVVAYSVTDPDHQVSSAFVWLPGLDDRTPHLRSTAPLQVASGAELTIDLADQVAVAAGRSPRITRADKVVAIGADGASLVKDATTLVYRSAPEWSGAGAITFEVTDGSGPDDPDGRTAVLTIPITVTPPANRPPTFVGGTVNVSPGEKATEVDLREMTQDPDPGDLDHVTYTVATPAQAGITVHVSGSTLSVSADAAVHKGTTLALALTLDDGKAAPAAGQLTVAVVASTRPLAVANDDVVDKAAQGQAQTVDVLANDANPFPDTPLTLVGAPVVESGQGTAAVVGDRVSVTPAADFVGTMTVRYRVQDATADPDRQVDGRIRLTVQGKPAVPGAPQVTSVRSRTVVLAWAPPADNGSRITSYTVRTDDGRSVPCSATTCTIDGLTNDHPYTFTVSATNEVGESAPSAPSAPARPDAQPSAPGAPTLTFGDRSLAVAWAAPTGYDGSPVQSYTLEISPAPPTGSPQRTGVTGTSYTWTGLENGVPYQVRVQALNNAPDPSDWSAYSATQVPAGVPATPMAPTTARLDPVGSQAQLSVAWTAPDGNGASVDSYTLAVLQGSTVVRSIPVPGGTTSQAVTVDTSETSYTFTVTATNKAGTSAASPASAPRRAFVAPGAVSDLTAKAGDNAVTLAFTAAPGNGATAAELAYQYRIGSGGWTALPADKVVRSGVTNNGTYTIGVRAVTTLDGVTYAGPETVSAAVQPFGAPNKPGASASGGDTTVTLSWSVPAANGRPIAKLQIAVDSGGWQDTAAANGSTTVGNGHSQSHSIQVRAVDAEGQTSAVASASAASAAAPPSVSVSKGPLVTISGCSSCHAVVITVANLTPGAHSVQFLSDADGGGVFYTEQINLPANGSVQTDVGYGFGGTRVWVVIDGSLESSHLAW